MRASLRKITASPSSSLLFFSPVRVSPFPPPGPPRGAQPAASQRCWGRSWAATTGSPRWLPMVPARRRLSVMVPGSGRSSPFPSPWRSLSQCVGFPSLCLHDECPHLLLLAPAPCESAEAAKLRQQIRNAKNFQRSLPILLFGKLLSITLCTENKHERKNSPLPSVVRAKTRIP